MLRTRGQSRELDFHNWDSLDYRGEGQWMQNYKFLNHIVLWNVFFAIICIPTTGKLIDVTAIPPSTTSQTAELAS
jgi:hypothetical protein